MGKVYILIKGCIILPVNGSGFIKDGILAMKNGKKDFVGELSSATHIKAEEITSMKGKSLLSTGLIPLIHR